MDIPSIKFKYFEKLKLWHDYLSGNSIFETTKKEYWEYEKMILVWAYSSFHQHLYTSIRNRRIFEAFGLEYNNETKKLDKRNRKEFEKIDLNDKKRRCYWTNLICKLFGSDGGKINYVMGNLAVKGLFEVTEGGDAITKPSAIRVTAKGLLLGELLHEGYCSDEYWKKNFRIYRLGYRVLQTIILIAVITIILVFLNQLWEFKDKVLSKYLQ